MVCYIINFYVCTTTTGRAAQKANAPPGAQKVWIRVISPPNAMCRMIATLFYFSDFSRLFLKPETLNVGKVRKVRKCRLAPMCMINTLFQVAVWIRPNFVLCVPLDSDNQQVHKKIQIYGRLSADTPY